MDIDIDAELAKFEAEERARLGLEAQKEQWTDRMIDPQFLASQRDRVTILLGGLTMAHDYLVEGALQGVGYRTRALDVPDHESLRNGKEYGNRGQCNPTYFTVGNLVKELKRIEREEGLTKEEVVDRYIFLTAGACGPCRFGMYVTEYRKALRDAGFDGFRVMLFQQTGGLKQATGEELGLVLNPTFFIAIAKALFSGDVINAISYRIRPYETEPGATDAAIQAVKDECYAALKEKRSIVWALYRARRHLAAVPVDKLRAKPKVSILGEFWAMTTEGAGNYHLQRFVEEEGGECDIQLIANLLLYNLWEFRFDTLDRMRLRGADASKFGLEGSDVGLTMAGLYLGELAVRGIFQTFAHALGLYHHHLPDMDEVAKVGHSHYNVHLRGGEGHMEVAKLILNVVKQKAHMTLSVKPFGCMPSSGVSDGVQSVITELLPDAIFCPVETSGDGAVNFYSRVQMYLFKARQRATEEFEKALADHGVTEADVRAFLEAHPRYAHPFHKPPHAAAGTAADLVHEVAPFVGKSAVGRAGVHARRALATAKRLATEDAPHVAGKVREAAPYFPSLLRYAAGEAASAIPSPRAAWSALLDRFFAPTEEQQAEVGRVEREQAMLDAAPVRTSQAARSDARRLDVVA
jgi:predicted nucleotide-binding protein (sugar kinase/HSP70/actin superfamily)